MCVQRELIKHELARSPMPPRLSSSPSDEALAASLSDILRSAEAVLCQLTGEALHSDTGELARPPGFNRADTDASSARVRRGKSLVGLVRTVEDNVCLLNYRQCSPMAVTEPALSHDPGEERKVRTIVPAFPKQIRVFCSLVRGGGVISCADHFQSAAPCISDHDLSELVSISPLFKTLQEIRRCLQDSAAAASPQNLGNGAQAKSNAGRFKYIKAWNACSPPAESESPEPEPGDGSLIPTPLDELSPRRAAVYLFGCRVMRLLASCPPFPSALLLPAKSLPAPVDPPASRWGEFHFDAVNQILYLSEEQLGHVGRFLATILQSMAYITSGDWTGVTQQRSGRQE